MNKYKLYQVDAFTVTPFKGNPAGVCIVDENCTDDWMQNIATEMNVSETAFIIPHDDFYNVRYFTPTVEVPLCGHATLASAHILYELGYCCPTETILIKTKGGELSIRKDDTMIIMNFPKYPIIQAEVPSNFIASTEISPVEFYTSTYDWNIAVLRSPEDVLNANPNFDLMKQNELGHLMITALNPNPESDFVVRCFAPKYGINEDPVTGSAHCALTPLWAIKTGKSDFKSLQLSKRGGELFVKLQNNRVEISGNAITIFAIDIVPKAF